VGHQHTTATDGHGTPTANVEYSRHQSYNSSRWSRHTVNSSQKWKNATVNSSPVTSSLAPKQVLWFT